MDQSSLTPERIARISHSLVLQRLQEIGQIKIADKISVDPSTISRDLEKLDRYMHILAYLDLQVVESSKIAVERHYFKSMATLAGALLRDQEALIEHVTGRR